MLPGCGHLAHLKDPAGFNAAVRGFLQRPAGGLSMDACPILAADAPIFDPGAFRLTPQEAALSAQAREFGQAVLAPRAARWDREASFPTENYRDMHANGLLGICIPAAEGGLGADFRAYCLTAAEMGRYCGATALTWNMHVCSTLWTGALTEDLDMRGRDVRAEHRRRRALHYARILRDGAVYAQPFSEGGAAAAGGVRLRHHGAARPRRLPGLRPEDLRAAWPGTPTSTACCAPRCGTARSGCRAATRSTSPSRATRRASRWRASGTRSACAAPSPATSSSATSSSRRTRR